MFSLCLNSFVVILPNQLHRMTCTSLLMNFATSQQNLAWDSQLRFEVHNLIDNYIMKLRSSQRTSGISNELWKPFVKSFVKRTVKGHTDNGYTSVASVLEGRQYIFLSLQLIPYIMLTWFKIKTFKICSHRSHLLSEWCYKADTYFTSYWKHRLLYNMYFHFRVNVTLKK